MRWVRIGCGDGGGGGGLEPGWDRDSCLDGAAMAVGADSCATPQLGSFDLPSPTYKCFLIDNGV